MTRSRAALAVASAVVAASCYLALASLVLGHFEVLELGIPFALYNTPIGMVLVLWLFDVDWRATSWPQRALVALVIAAALVRAFTRAPPWSGHALFLAFALGSARSWWVRAAALAALVQVVMLKVRFDDVSWAWGTGAGLALALVFARVSRVPAHRA